MTLQSVSDIYININTTYSNNVFWRLLFYLNNNNNSIFLFIITFLFFFTNLKKSNKLLIFLMLFFILNNFLLNTNFFLEDFLRNNNIPLSNGILLIHPFFIYGTYVMSYSVFNVFFPKKTLETTTLCAYTAILLGSWWAQQELNWGGWWNWDYVELIAFIFLLYPLIFVHIKKKYIYFFKLTYKNNLYYYFLLFFIIVRCDILSSIHSFNSFNFLEKYLYYVFAFFLFFIMYFLVFKKWFFLYKEKITYFKVKNIKFIFFISIISLIVVFILANTFIFLITQFQYVNSFFFLKIVFWLFFFYYILINFSKKLLIMIFIIGVYDFLFLLFIFCFVELYNFFFKSKKQTPIHVCIILFFFINEYTTFFFSNIQLSDVNFITTLNFDFFQNSPQKFYLGKISSLYSYIYNKLLNNLNNGCYDVLYLNSINWFGFCNILYDLLNSTIVVSFKNFLPMFVISFLFLIYMCFYVKTSKTFKVV